MTNICAALDSSRFHPRYFVLGERNQSIICCDCVLFFRIIKGQGIDIKSLSSRSVLTVTNMTEDRYGNYTCVASNKLGTANASVPLNRKLSFYLLVANWSAEESEGWKSVVDVSGGFSALKSVFIFCYNFLVIEKKRFNPSGSGCPQITSKKKRLFPRHPLCESVVYYC